MNVGDIRKQLEGLDDDLEVFMRCAVNPCGNIISVGAANKDTYGFFGKSVDCIIIEPESFEDEEDEEDKTEKSNAS